MTREEMRDRLRELIEREQVMLSAAEVADMATDDLWPEVERLKALTAECTCGATYATYEGPEPDCAVHGAVRALNEAQAALTALTAIIDAAPDGSYIPVHKLRDALRERS